MPGFTHIHPFRIRYSETDQLGTFYNSRALEWFEVGRSELLRAAGLAYAEMELQGFCLPLVEAHVKYHGRARYDDQLEMTSVATMAGKASVRFEVTIVHAASRRPVVSGYTVHAVTNPQGRPVRCPEALSALLGGPESAARIADQAVRP